MMRRYIALVFILVAVNSADGLPERKSKNAATAKDHPVSPDCKRRALETILSKGFKGEEYNVTTDDGYILTIQRIPPVDDMETLKAKGLKTAKAPVIMLQHGLEGSSPNFLDNYYPYQNLGFFLAQAGMDVWLANSRGNSYALNHVSGLNSDDREFWKFSWDEMAQYDIPATIDFILDKTESEELYYVGHSQGTLVGFAAFSINETVADKVKKFFAVAPIGKVNNIQSAFKLLAPFSNIFAEIDYWFGKGEFAPRKDLRDKLTSYACSGEGDKFKNLCQNLEFVLYGHNATLWNTSRIPVYMCHSPDSTSAMDIAHFGQMINSGKIQMFNFGDILNHRNYGQGQPPEYDFKNMDVPLVMFTGGRDKLADPEDVEWLIKLFDSTGVLEAVYDMPYYDHLDYIFASDAPKNVYARIVDHVWDDVKKAS